MTVTSQTNHIYAAILAFVKLEALKLNHQHNHFALKHKLYLTALKASLKELENLKKHTNSGRVYQADMGRLIFQTK